MCNVVNEMRGLCGKCSGFVECKECSELHERSMISKQEDDEVRKAIENSKKSVKKIVMSEIPDCPNDYNWIIELSKRTAEESDNIRKAIEESKNQESKHNYLPIEEIHGIYFNPDTLDLNAFGNNEFCPHGDIANECASCIRKNDLISKIKNLLYSLKYEGTNRVRIPGDGFCSLWALYTYILLSVNNSDFSVEKIFEDIEIMKIMVDTGATIKQAISQIFQLSIDTQSLDIFSESLRNFQKLYGKRNNNDDIDIDIDVISNINIELNINNSIKYSYILNSPNHFDLIHNNDTDFESFDISRLDALHWLLEQFSKYSDESQKYDPKELEELCRKLGVNPICGFCGCNNKNHHSHL